jgi:hypothetical protein
MRASFKIQILGSLLIGEMIAHFISWCSFVEAARQQTDRNSTEYKGESGRRCCEQGLTEQLYVEAI